MATTKEALIPRTVNSDYRTFPNPGEESGQSSPLKEKFLRSRSADFWGRFLSSLVAIVTIVVLVMFIVAYCSDTGFHYDNTMRFSNEEPCTIRIDNSDINRFEDLVIDRNMDVLYVNFTTSVSVNETNNTEIYQPNEWIWTHGDSPILVWPESYELWSFGILDLHTERNVNMLLELSPPGCSFTWGDRSTSVVVGKALLNFTKVLFKKLKKLKKSKWCYTVRLRDIKRNRVLEQDFSFFVQDLGYKCCEFDSDPETSDMVATCDEQVIVERLWTNIPFIFAFVTLLISPIAMVFVYQFLSFKSHVYWIHNKEQFPNDYASTADEWLYTDYKSPITFLSFLRRITHTFASHEATENAESPTRVVRSGSWRCCCCSGCCSHSLKRFVKYVFLAVTLVLLSLSVILISLLMYKYDEISYKMLKREIENGIPIGFLSLLFSYDENYDNFMFKFKGPYVFISVYVVLAFVYLLVFEYFKPVQDYDTGNFTLNLDLVEKHGRIRCTVENKYGIFETIHANSRAIFRGGFWKELIERLVKGDEAICLSQCSTEWTRLVLNFLKMFILFFSILFSVCAHLIPFLFAGLLILTDCIRRTRTHWLLDYFLILILSSVHICLVFSFTIIFFGSAEFLFLIFSFCVLSLILFPGTASGIFVFSLVGVYYIVERFRGIAKKYATYRDLAISVSQSLSDKCKGAEAMVSEDKETLLIAGVNLYAVEYIALVCGPKSRNRKKHGSFHCHLKDKTLKILGEINASLLKNVSIGGIPVKFGGEPQKEKRHGCQSVLYRIEFGHSQILLVPVPIEGNDKTTETIINFNDTSEDDTCYVTYRNALPGIPWKLMDTIVEEYIPVSAERLQAIIWMIFVSSVFAWLSIIIKRFDQWENMSTIVNALIVVLLVKMSEVVKMFSVDIEEAHKMIILRDQIKRTVQNYWMKLKYQQSLQTDRDSPSTSEYNPADGDSLSAPWSRPGFTHRSETSAV